MNRVCSIFAQLLQLFPRDQFQQAVQEHAERRARGFTCWGQFVAVMFLATRRRKLESRHVGSGTMWGRFRRLVCRANVLVPRLVLY